MHIFLKNCFVGTPEELKQLFGISVNSTNTINEIKESILKRFPLLEAKDISVLEERSKKELDEWISRLDDIL